MINIKKVKILIAMTVAMFALTACGSNGTDSEKANVDAAKVQDSSEETSKSEEETDNLEEEIVIEMDINEFSQKIVDRRTDIAFAQMTEGYISGVMNFDVSKVTEYAVYVDATGTTVDEFGIFKAEEGLGEEVEEMLTEYLQTRLDTWMEEYMPEEKPKVENAQIKTKGNYYIYTILGDSEKEQVFTDFDSVLSK